MYTGLIPGLRPANERRRYKVTPFLIGANLESAPVYIPHETLDNICCLNQFNDSAYKILPVSIIFFTSVQYLVHLSPAFSSPQFSGDL